MITAEPRGQGPQQDPTQAPQHPENTPQQPQPDMRCKLFNFDENNKWRNNGVGKARIDNLDGRWLAIFEADDGSEAGWEIRPESDFKRDQNTVISFFCVKTSTDHAMSFKFEQAASSFWARINQILEEMMRPPEDNIPVPARENLAVVETRLRELGLPVMTLLRSAKLRIGLFGLFEEVESSYIINSRIESEEYQQKSRNDLEVLQQLVGVVHELRKC